MTRRSNIQASALPLLQTAGRSYPLTLPLSDEHSTYITQDPYPI